MKKSFAAAALGASLMCAPAIAQPSVGGPVTLPAGQSYTFTYEVSETFPMQGHDATVGANLVYRVDVLSDAPNNRRWRYTPVSINYTNLEGMVPEMAMLDANLDYLSAGISAFMRIATDVGFECRVDDSGRCIEWTNWPVWNDRLENTVLMIDAFASMAQSFAGASAAGAPAGKPDAAPNATPPNTWATLREPVLKSIGIFLDGITPQSASAFMAGTNPASGLQGRALTRGSPANVVDEFMMPFNAPPMRMQAVLTLQSVNTRNNTAVVTRTASLDQDSMRASLQGMSDFIIKDALAPVQPLLDEQGADQVSMLSMVGALLPQININFTENSRGTLDLTTGLISEMTSDYVVTIVPPGQTATANNAAPPTTVRLHLVSHFTPGAPAVPRLPREPAGQ